MNSNVGAKEVYLKALCYKLKEVSIFGFFVFSIKMVLHIRQKQLLLARSNLRMGTMSLGDSNVLDSLATKVAPIYHSGPPKVYRHYMIDLLATNCYTWPRLMHFFFFLFF